MPAYPGSSKFTGRTRYRLTWRGKLVFQAQLRELAPHQLERSWRDVTVNDLNALRYAIKQHATLRRACDEHGAGKYPFPPLPDENSY